MAVPPELRARWQSASPYLDTALDLAPEARARWLDDLRARAPEMAEVVAAWLDECSALESAGFLDDTAAAAPVEHLTGLRVGPYELTSPVGHGGMGSVWRARRVDGRYDADVAVKLLNVSLVGRGGETRFAQEGRILASLAHPGIARLIDAGASAIGQPYLVLEFVNGVPIDEYCDAHGLDVDARVRLMIDVIAAVAHAHANLVVHRDLKPSNVLVTTGGTVKLLDFGIARLLAPDPATPHLTRDGDAVLTPAYAAPEQVSHGAITTATDVYALGVLLHVLLSGRHPAEPHLEAPAELLRAITEVDPPPMSSRAVIDGAHASAATLAAARGTSPDRLRACLSGDLDTIVATALKKAPAERYASADALASDLRRALAHEPIAARPPSAWYRLARFTRRHRLGVGLGAAAVLALVTATAVATVQLFEARRQRDEARFQSRRAQASSEFMRNLVTQIGETPMTMRQVLDRGRQALEQQYGGDRAFVARMLMTLSGPYVELNDDATASRMMAEALRIGEELNDPEITMAAHCGSAWDTVERGEAEAARTHLEAAARLVPRTGRSRQPIECYKARTRLGMLERRYDDAIAFAREEVAFLKEAGDTRSTTYTSTINNLATALTAAGRTREALEVQREVSAVSVAIGRGRTSAVVVSLQNEATMQRALGHWLAAAASYDEAQALAASMDTGGRVPGYLLVNRARLDQMLGRDDEARNRLAAARRGGDLTAPFAAVADLIEAAFSLEAGDSPHARASLDAFKATPSVNAGGARFFVALLETALIEREQGAREARRALAASLTSLGYPATPLPPHVELLERLADFDLRLGDLVGAERTSREALSVAASQIGSTPASAYTGRAYTTLGQVLERLGRKAEARRALETATALLTTAAGPDHAWTVFARSQLVASSR